MLWVQKWELGENYYCLFHAKKWVPLSIWCFKLLHRGVLPLGQCLAKLHEKRRQDIQQRSDQRVVAPLSFHQISMEGLEETDSSISYYVLPYEKDSCRRTAEHVPHQYPSSRISQSHLRTVVLSCPLAQCERAKCWSCTWEQRRATNEVSIQTFLLYLDLPPHQTPIQPCPYMPVLTSSHWDSSTLTKPAEGWNKRRGTLQIQLTPCEFLCALSPSPKADTMSLGHRILSLRAGPLSQESPAHQRAQTLATQPYCRWERLQALLQP